MGIDDMVAAFRELPGAAVGIGPQHPRMPQPALSDALTWFFDEQYPGLRSDPEYVEFMWKYAGLSRLDEGRHHLFYLFGFGAATADIIHDLDENLADEEGMFTFAACTVDGDITERPLDSYSVDFGFDLTGSRLPGVYRRASTTQVPQSVWVWHTHNFTSFLIEMVATGGVWPRPIWGDKREWVAKTCQFWQHNRKLQQIFAVVMQVGSPPVAYGPLTPDEIWMERVLRPHASGLPAGDAALAAELASRMSEFHDLGDFYRYAGYSDEVIAWVEATEINRHLGHDLFRAEGREPYEVADKLALDRDQVVDAAWAECIIPRTFDPEGREVYYEQFWDNWAVGDLSGLLAVNPKSYRFKAWVAFTIEGRTG